MALKKIEHKMPKGQTMRLSDVEAWVADMRNSGATGDELVTAETTTWGFKLQRLEAEVEMVPAPEVKS